MRIINYIIIFGMLFLIVGQFYIKYNTKRLSFHGMVVNTETLNRGYQRIIIRDGNLTTCISLRHNRGDIINLLITDSIFKNSDSHVLYIKRGDQEIEVFKDVSYDIVNCN